MIRKLKTKFIILVMTALFCLLFFVVVGMNLLNYHSIVKEADDLLRMIANNSGEFPTSSYVIDEKIESPEIPYELRYFSVVTDSDGKILQTELNRIVSVEKAQAILYTEQVLQTEEKTGFIETYRFIVYNEEDNIRVSYLDCGRKLAAFENTLYISIIMALLGYVIVLFVSAFFAEKILHPISESYEKQKRFITDAGHEIKTPLTIINANIDVLEMEYGENECFIDIQTQTNRLKKLTNDLIYMAQMEERKDVLSKTKFSLSDLTAETISLFYGLAQTQKKVIHTNIKPLLYMTGNAEQIERLISILMDNAIKYSPENSEINITLEKKGKQIVFIITNKTREQIAMRNMSMVFERFFRMDSSRNSETGGHGIGLSMAKAIVEFHGGRIKAWSEKERIFGITVIFSM